MNIGDKVRLIHSKEEGIVTRILPNNVIEIEIEDGFRLPVLKRELAVVSAVEAQAFRTVKPQATPDKATDSRPTGIRAEKGIFMAFVPLNDREIVLHLINNTDWDLPYSLTTPTERHQRGIAGGYLKAKSAIKVHELLIKDFEDWGTFVFHCLYFTVGFSPERAPLTKRIKFRANTFFNNKRKAPILEKDAYLFQLDADEKLDQPLNAQELKEKMMEKNEPEPAVSLPIERPSSVVDLHIEKLTRDFLALNNNEMIAIQLKTFEQQLEKAIASGMDEITFIHGVGNGVLRTELHRRMSKHKNVKFYEDAQKEKFGYGATKVKIK
ncbi:Smr/MutS family protein [Runella sp. SP2]|uniref:Smr/MutS family protein n=1 Tax=Runella sp. SP2 TaxID=2268026 RepID=UPI000F07D7AE|nr:Smr/MutS family protein [Runella sp. SP2]AYQ32741.1 DNA mismatch repair protein MutS [Runella sp. SP2]